MNVVMNFRVPWNAGNFLTSWEPARFLRSTQLHGVWQEVPFAWRSIPLTLSQPMKVIWLRNYTWLKLVVGLNLVDSVRLILLTSLALKFARLQFSATVQPRPSVFCMWRIVGCSRLPIFRDCWTLEGGTVGLSRIVGDQIATYASYHPIMQCISTFVRPWPGKFFFHKTRVRSQQIYSSVPFQFFLRWYIKLT